MILYPVKVLISKICILVSYKVPILVQNPLHLGRSDQAKMSSVFITSRYSFKFVLLETENTDLYN